MKKLWKEAKGLIIYGLVLFVAISMVYLTISLVIQVKSNEIRKNQLIENETRLVDVEKTIVSYKINRLITEVLYIADSLTLNNNCSAKQTDIENQWIAFSDRKKIYDQIRYIDLKGNEIVRINYSPEGSYATKKEQLQNKKDRYYFTDTLKLKPNQIYISKIDLNVEHDKIEQPIKPMIRLSTPYYDNKGILQGVIILNYYADDMLQQVQKIASTSQGTIYMLNSSGYWVYNSADRSKEWTFMYEDKKDISFQKEQPQAWRYITNKGKSYDVNSNGIFTYTNLLMNNDLLNSNSNVSLVLGDGDWYIVSHITPKMQNAVLISTNLLTNSIYIITHNILGFCIIFVLAIIFSILIILNKIKKDEVKYYSEYDAMTGVYNRRAGLERIDKICRDAIKDRIKISVCFVDINGLKDVNDALGHEAGDELILSVIYGIKVCIRNTDLVARLGGDEFIILLKGMDEAEAEKIWSRINAEYQKINDTQNRKYIISASHGIEEFEFVSNEYIETVINHADEKMYIEKRKIKQDLKVIR